MSFFLLHFLRLQCVDYGEDIGVPDDFSDQDMISGMWWRHLVAGGVAGGVSRTCTAPLDRLKIFLQVSALFPIRFGLLFSIFHVLSFSVSSSKKDSRDWSV